MGFNSKVKKGLAVSLSAATVMGMGVMPAFAQDSETEIVTTIEKISNPDSGEREADGLVEGGDRETSYAWCMAARGDYIYIGTNKNIVGDIVNSLVSSLVSAGMNADTVWSIVDVVTNGEVPRPATTEGGYIFRCNQKTGEITKIYTAPAGVSFRMAIEFDGNVYFGSYSTAAGFVGPDGTTSNLSNDIIRIDADDNVEKVFSSYNGTSMRAACVHEGALYFGGADATEVLEEGDEACAKLAILRKSDTDDGKWERVADYKDFGEYSANPAVANAASSPIWDICSYDGYIYATIPNGRGFVMFKGHPAAEGEEANAYGWCWTEVVGKYNGINNLGLSDSPEGYSGAQQGLISIAATPFVFNDKLYVMDFDHTIGSISQAMSGVVGIIGGKDVKASDYLRSTYTSLQHPQSLYCYNDETGAFEEVESFNEYMEGTCNEYLWRAGVYDGELYISTMDSAVLYNYITKLTNGSFSEMTPQEMKDQINYVKVLLEKLGYLDETDEKVAEIKAVLEEVENMLKEFIEIEVDEEQFKNFVSKYSEIIEKLKGLSGSFGSDAEFLGETYAEEDGATDSEGKVDIDSIVDSFKGFEGKLEEIYNNIDWEGLEMYIYISEMVKNNTWGFDLFKTADGENFEVVTLDGFGDKYNYGGRSLATGEDGIYVGTANPFYGAQLWKITNTTVTPEEPSEEPGEEPSEEPGEEPSEEPDEQPSEQPSEEPGEQPSEQPSEEPGEEPSEQPGNTDTSTSDTGDHSNLFAVYAAMIMAAVSFAAAMAITNKKKKESDK